MHLDGDHTGWAFSQEQDGTYRKMFPAARYLIAEGQRGDRDFAWLRQVMCPDIGIAIIYLDRSGA